MKKLIKLLFVIGLLSQATPSYAASKSKERTKTYIIINKVPHSKGCAYIVKRGKVRTYYYGDCSLNVGDKIKI